MPEARQARQTAYKVWIRDLVNGNYIKDENEWAPNYILINGNKVSRVNIIANVIQTYKNEDNSYNTIVIDDGSGNIKIKAWREDIVLISGINIADIILVIGRVRKYGDEIYVTPEIIKKLNNTNWELVRKLELEKLHGKISKQIKEYEHVKEDKSNMNINELNEPPVIEKVVETKRQKILNLIEKLDKRESNVGVLFEDLIKSSELNKEEAKLVIEELLKEGEIFEINGSFKIT